MGIKCLLFVLFVYTNIQIYNKRYTCFQSVSPAEAADTVVIYRISLICSVNETRNGDTVTEEMGKLESSSISSSSSVQANKFIDQQKCLPC